MTEMEKVAPAAKPDATPSPRFDPSAGINAPLESWCRFNLAQANAGKTDFIAPFPPAALMLDTSGLTNNAGFARHGVDILRALVRASPVPLPSLPSLLDFGIGGGRLARMFKGFRGRYVGVDVDPRSIAWVREALPEVDARLTSPRAPLPIGTESLDAVISVSVFTHLNVTDHFFYLRELQRLCRSGAVLLLTVHGQQALRRAENDEGTFRQLAVPRGEIADARGNFDLAEGYHFIRQNGHLTTDSYDYGITFISEQFIRREWRAFFEVCAVHAGAIHNWQDIVVLRKR